MAALSLGEEGGGREGGREGGGEGGRGGGEGEGVGGERKGWEGVVTENWLTVFPSGSFFRVPYTVMEHSGERVSAS